MITKKGAALALGVLGVATTAVLARAWALVPIGTLLFLLLAFGALRDQSGAPRLAASHAMAPPMTARPPAPANPSTPPPAAAATAPRLLAGDAPRVVTVVRNEGPALGLCEVEVPLPEATATKGGTPLYLARIPRAADSRTTFDLSVPVRGRFELAEVRVRERGLLGLFRREGIAPAALAFTVLPRREDVGDVRFFTRRLRPIAGPVAIGRIGAGQEFYGLRKYLAGDPIDAVNWRQTARHGRPFVNEFEREAPADVLLALDTRGFAEVGRAEWTTLEAGIRAVVSLAEAALDDRAKVGLLLLGDRLEWLHPASGRRQQEKIVGRLLELRAGGTGALTTLLSSAPPNVLPRGADIFLVTPGVEDASLPRAVEGLAARGLRVVVVSPGPETAELAAGGLGLAGDAAARVLRIERRRFLDRVRRAGAEVVDWDVREPLAAALSGLGGRGRR